MKMLNTIFQITQKSFFSDSISIAFIQFDNSHMVISNGQLFVVLCNILLALKVQVFNNLAIIFIILPFFNNFNFLNFSILRTLYLIAELNKILMHLIKIKLLQALAYLLDKSNKFNFFNNILFFIKKLIQFSLIDNVSPKN